MKAYIGQAQERRIAPTTVTVDFIIAIGFGEEREVYREPRQARYSCMEGLRKTKQRLHGVTRTQMMEQRI